MNYSMIVKYICNKCGNNKKRVYMTLYGIDNNNLLTMGPSMVKRRVECANCKECLTISSMVLEEQGSIFEWECRMCGQIFITTCMNGDDFEAILNEVACPNKGCLSTHGEVNYRRTLTSMEANGEVGL